MTKIIFKSLMICCLCLAASFSAYGQLLTLEPRNITATSAMCGGRVSTNSTVGQILERGICYAEKGTEAAKTLNRNDSKIVANGAVARVFEGLRMTGLKKNTTYQVRAYIIADGISYGNIQEFTTLESDSAPTGTGIGKPTATTDPGVVINSVCWATRNVGAPGTFAPKPESSGMLYRWNSKKAWPSTGPVDDWDDNKMKGDFWAKVNDPCPPGWWMPTYDEISSLELGPFFMPEIDPKGVRIGEPPHQLYIPIVQMRHEADGFLQDYKSHFKWICAYHLGNDSRRGFHVTVMEVHPYNKDREKIERAIALPHALPIRCVRNI